ncbi:MAG: FAD-dependent monooxygenase, partial [Acidobacteriota bacterium]
LGIASALGTGAEQFFANPTGSLGTVKCWPWNVAGRSLLLGDAAHALVPFYGQGMNCAFEDVRVLDSLLSEPGALMDAPSSAFDWQSVYTEYGQLRKINTDAIADMAE